jgi:hypothetical protein
VVSQRTTLIQLGRFAGLVRRFRDANDFCVALAPNRPVAQMLRLNFVMVFGRWLVGLLLHYERMPKLWSRI